MKEAVNYQIVKAGTVTRLEAKVREQIEGGWEPLGGVAVFQQLSDDDKSPTDNTCTLYDNGQVYLQAMVKR